MVLRNAPMSQMHSGYHPFPDMASPYRTGLHFSRGHTLVGQLLLYHRPVLQLVGAYSGVRQLLFTYGTGCKLLRRDRILT